MHGLEHRGTKTSVKRAHRLVVITWGLPIERHTPAFVIQENVRPFPGEILLEIVGPEYTMEVLHMDPRDRGWPVARRRKYALLIHESAKLEVELDVLRPLLEATAPRGSALTFAVAPGDPRALSAREKQGLAEYKRLWSGTAWTVCDVSQNPAKRPRGSLIDNCLCTLTCSSCRLFMPQFSRCLSGRELLLAQAFPSTGWACSALGFRTK